MLQHGQQHGWDPECRAGRGRRRAAVHVCVLLLLLLNTLGREYYVKWRAAAAVEWVEVVIRGGGKQEPRAFTLAS